MSATTTEPEALKREWVGLTEEERDDIDQAYRSRMQALFAIEAKLKEKNHDTR
jgi:hypothetical protein